MANAKKTHQMDLEGSPDQAAEVPYSNAGGVVERTWAWGINVRQQARDYQVLTRHSGAWI